VQAGLTVIGVSIVVLLLALLSLKNCSSQTQAVVLTLLVVAAIAGYFTRDDVYRHRHGSKGHGRDHVLPAFVAPSVTLPVLAGRPALGTWQSVVLVDSNGDNPVRRVRLSFLSG